MPRTIPCASIRSTADSNDCRNGPRMRRARARRRRRRRRRDELVLRAIDEADELIEPVVRVAASRVVDERQVRANVAKEEHLADAVEDVGVRPAGRPRRRCRSGSGGRSCGSSTPVAASAPRRRSRSRSDPRAPSRPERCRSGRGSARGAAARRTGRGRQPALAGMPSAAPLVRSRCATRSTMTRVLPVPAPAMTTSGPSSHSTIRR